MQLSAHVLATEEVEGITIVVTDLTERKRTEQEIASLAKFPTENLNPVMRIQRDGTLLFANEVCFSLLPDWKLEMGRPVPLDLKETVLETLAAGIVRIIETEQNHRIISFQVAPIVDEGYVNLYGRDITIRRQSERALEKSEELYRTLVEQASDSIFLADWDGHFLEVNSAGSGMLGYTRAEILHLSMSDLIKLSPDELLRFKEVQEGKTLLYEREMIRKDGTLFPVEISAKQLPDGRLLWIVRDISERKQAEAVLHQRLIELEAIQTVSRALRTAQTLDEALPILLEKTLSTLDTDTGMICLYQPESDELRAVAVCGLCTPMKGLITKPGQGIIGSVFLNGQEYFARDLGNDPLAHRLPEMNLPPNAGGYYLPIRTDYEMVGVFFVLVSAPDNFTPDQINLLNSLVEMAGSAIHRMRLYEETKEYATQFGLLYDAGLAINSVLETDEQLKFLFTIALKTLNVDQAAFFRYNLIQDDLDFELGLGFNAESQAALQDLRLQGKGDEHEAVGWVAKNCLPLNLVELTSLSLGPRIDSQIVSELYVPIQHNQTLIGVLGVFSPRGKAFSLQAERLLLLFANQAAVAIQNTRLITETRRHLEYLNTLHKIDIAIAGSFNLPKILAVILEQVTTQLHVDAACLLLLNPRNQVLEYVAGRGFHTKSLQTTLLKVGEGFAGRSFQERRIINVPDLRRRDTGALRSPNFLAEKFIAYYAIPLLAKNEVLGVLEIFHRSPLNPAQDWLDFLETLAGQAAIAINNTQLFDQLQSANQDLTLAYDETIEGWSKALDLRDEETEGHTLRVTEMTLALAQEMGIGQEELVHIRRGCLLHDIGKLGVPDAILQKQGPLTEEEWNLMKKHPTFAYEMIVPIVYLKPAIDIPYCHHEKWDGSGYPRGLKGEDIPLTARIFAIIDVWDALTSDRIYRPAWSKKEALVYIQEQSEKQFDPLIVEKFLTFIGNWDNQANHG